MIEIVYESPQAAIVIKPSGLGSEEKGLVTVLRDQLGCDIFPVHRLDQPVGGLMIYGKSPQAAEKLKNDLLAKEYLAIVPDHLAKDEDTLEDLLFHDRTRNKTFVVSRQRNGVKKAVLHYRVLERKPGVALLRIALQTGRTHQIRVQFASRRMPLLGDGKYGSKLNTPIALWSCHLRFRDPSDGLIREFTRMPPAVPPWNQHDFEYLK
ncbi:MAG: RluA family pseudouridine synthase [Erysipelotrichaceae bacterium]|nr:RluA family pseudouridine synthase [Erysipelotrichaceae bacterium]